MLTVLKLIRGSQKGQKEGSANEKKETGVKRRDLEYEEVGPELGRVNSRPLNSTPLKSHNSKKYIEPDR